MLELIFRANFKDKELVEKKELRNVGCEKLLKITADICGIDKLKDHRRSIDVIYEILNQSDKGSGVLIDVDNLTSGAAELNSDLKDLVRKIQQSNGFRKKSGSNEITQLTDITKPKINITKLASGLRIEIEITGVSYVTKIGDTDKKTHASFSKYLFEDFFSRLTTIPSQ